MPFGAAAARLVPFRIDPLTAETKTAGPRAGRENGRKRTV